MSHAVWFRLSGLRLVALGLLPVLGPACGPMDAADAPALDPAAPVVAAARPLTVLATLDRAYQDVTVQTSAVAAGAVLTLELWSDGTAAESAGNGLQLQVLSTGRTSAQARLGSDLVPLDSDLGAAPLVSGKPLRLRLGLVGTDAVLHVDAQQGGAWQSDVARYTFGYTRPLFGRRVVSLAQPAGLTISVQPTAPTAALSFHRAYDRVIDWKLYQRSGASANIPLPLFYRSPVAAQLAVDVLVTSTGAPLSGYAQQRFALAAAATGQSAQVTLPLVPQGGNYNLRAVLTRADTGAQLGADTVQNIAVGDVFLALGQSNMTGFAALSPAEAPISQVHLFGNDYYWKQAAEPMDSGDDQVDRVSEEVPGHSLMLRFAKEIYAATGVPVAILPGPRYGTNIDYDWARDSAQPLSRGTLYGSAVYRALSQGYGAAVRGVLWWQGEGNAGSGVDNYRTLLAALVSHLRADLGSAQVFFGNCQLSTLAVNTTDADWSDYLQPQEAQRQYALQDARSVVVPMIDLPRGDEYHLNNPGVKQAGVRLAYGTLVRSYGLAPVLGPALGAARFVTGVRNQIEVVYDKATTGGAVGLYRVADSSGTFKPSAIGRSGTALRLTLPRSASGTTRLSYGYSSNPSAAWVKGADGSGAALLFRDLTVQ